MLPLRNLSIWKQLLKVFDADHPEAWNLVNDSLHLYLDSCAPDDVTAQALKTYRDTGVAPEGVTNQDNIEILIPIRVQDKQQS